MKRDVLKIDKYKSKKLHRVGQERNVGQKRFSTMSSSLKNILANVKYVKSDVYTWKETYIHKKETFINIYEWKKTCTVLHDEIESQIELHDTFLLTRETYIFMKRDLCKWKETYSYVT